MDVRQLVIVPAHEASFDIVPRVWRIRREAPGAAVLVVDGGSTDGTGDLAMAVGRSLGDVFVLRRLTDDDAYEAGMEWARDHGYAVIAYRDSLDRAA